MSENSRFRSPDWQYFSKDEQPRCLLCKEPKVFVAQNRNTGNLKSHLKHVHPATHDELYASEKELPSTNTAAEQHAVVSYLPTSERARRITNAIGEYIFAAGLPLSTVEKPSLRNLLRTLDPRYQCISRKQLTDSVLPDAYRALRAKVQRTAVI
jgi:hypothetical protein